MPNICGGSVRGEIELTLHARPRAVNRQDCMRHQRHASSFAAGATKNLIRSRKRSYSASASTM
jgi:hypothetical protein